MTKRRYPATTIIGAGSVGTAIAYSLYDIGYPIVSIISKTRQSAEKLAKTVLCNTASTSMSEISPDTTLIILAVPDSVIPDVEKQIAGNTKLQFKKLTVLHTAGILSASILKYVKKQEAATAAVHPIQTFPKTSNNILPTPSLEGIYFGIDCEKKSLPFIKQIVRDMGGKPVLVPESMRARYHASCVFSSSFLVVHMNAIAELSKPFTKTESWYQIFNPLLSSSVQNMLETSASQALTGPILRNDLKSIELHLKTLTKFAPELIPFYTVCASEVARIAKTTKRISDNDFQSIHQLLNKFPKHKQAKRKVSS